MPCMSQKSTNLLGTPHTPPISVRRPPRHHWSSPEGHPPQDPPAASTHDTARSTSHPWDHPAPPSPTKSAQDHPYIDVDAQDLNSPPRQAPPDPEHPPLTRTTIRHPDLLRAALQGRALDTPLGWYRLQEDRTKLTVKALQDLATPGKGLHEAIVDLVLWRARQHAQGQQVWIPPIEWGQALTHDTDTNVTGRGTTRLRQAPAERDRPADPNHPEQWEQATAPTRDTALRAAGLRIPYDDLPPRTYRQRPSPAGGLAYSPRARALLRSGRHSNIPRPTMARQRDRHHARPGAAPPGTVGDSTTPHKVLRGVLQPEDKAPARALA